MIDYEQQTEYVPEGHNKQGDVPVVLLYWPAGQDPLIWAMSVITYYLN